MSSKAVVLLSGGMDSAVAFYMAKRSHECYPLVFDYGQKASREIEAAGKLASAAGTDITVLNISMPWKGSALIDAAADIPSGEPSSGGRIPSTYVPARNIIFLSFGVSYAEAVGAGSVYIGAHQMDFSNYPDCRSVFFDRYRDMIREGTRSGSEGTPVRIETPIIDLTKREILEKGAELGVPFEHTWSCYAQGDVPCGKCESCYLRAKAFEQAGRRDPLVHNGRTAAS